MRDNFVKAIVDIIAAIFWWVPVKYLRNSLLNAQELACDRSALLWGIEQTALASAIVKSAKSMIATQRPLYGSYLAHSFISVRIKTILQSEHYRLTKTKQFGLSIFFLLMLELVLLGRFWIF
jgi:beta-lactamase regulating signal transducer with metallopeptidase domain